MPWTRIVGGGTATPPMGKRSGRLETERARATHDFDTLAAMAVAATEVRRKRRHRQSLSSSEEDEEEDEAND